MKDTKTEKERERRHLEEAKLDGELITAKNERIALENSELDALHD